MNDAAKHLIGTHDFAAFQAAGGTPRETTVRTIYEFEVTKHGRRITFRVKGSGFLYKQVRSMVGMLIRVGTGAEKAERITELLDSSAPRTAHVPSAPPQGLTLWRVWYND